MAMSELKQRLLKMELARLGFPDAQYSEANSLFRLSPSDSRLPKIYNNGDIHYGGEYDRLVVNQIQPLVNRVNEIVDAWEKAPAAVGQYQHGSAKWLTDKEKDKAFDSFILDPNDVQIRMLLQNVRRA